MASNVSFDSAFYPYEKVMTGYNSMRGSEQIPLKLITYLLDLPDKYGYIPKDDNGRARVRFIKYVWYDGANPLGEALPTAEEKMSLLFDGNRPDINTDERKAKHPKGYRLFPQVYWGQAELDAATSVKCYLGRNIPNSPFSNEIGVYFEILCNADQEGNTKTNAYSRSYDIEQAIVESLHGVNIAGVGVCDFSRYVHTDNGSKPLWDDGYHVGRSLHMSIHWMESSDVRE